MEKRVRSFKLYYFAIGIIASLYTSMMPSFYANLNMSEGQIGVLLSVVYLGAIFQPAIGMISDKAKSRSNVIRNSMYIVIGLSTVLLFVEEFYPVLFIVTGISFFRMAFFSLSDSYMMPFCIEYDYNYGKLRRGASLSFGMAMILAYPFNYFLGFHGFLILVILMCLLAANVMHKSTYEPPRAKNSSHYISEMKKYMKSKAVISLLLFQLFFMGSLALKFSYQAIKLQELTGDTGAASIALLCATVPEVLFMAKVSARSKMRLTSALLAATIFNIVQLFVFSQTTSVAVMIIFATFHGFSMSYYIPTFSRLLTELVGEGVISTFFTISGTGQSLFSLLLSLVVVTPVFINFGVDYVFVVIGISVICSIIPLLYLRIKYQK